ncbi:hypothetical protein DAEQUDRAFT_81449 [Daedalea quercina L-15889]|uniref:Uncharacterized protein n=1 Tax=Daedalea quercina L-15889 TaxID=1314783 RepID=A0A165SH15_9APHY|nr:hypothetical protein DAEQUDRAFT_81449 [Daedalea quercina L-15889]
MHSGLDWLARRLSSAMMNCAFRSAPPRYCAGGKLPSEVDPTCTQRWKLAGASDDSTVFSDRFTPISRAEPETRCINLWHGRRLQWTLGGRKSSIVPLASLESWGFEMGAGNLTFFVVIVCFATVLSAGYGAPHLILIGWNASFSTDLERVLWRIATVAFTGASSCASGSLVLLASFASASYYHEDGDAIRIAIQRGIFSITGGTYIVASAYLVLESLRQLFYLPPAAFE